MTPLHFNLIFISSGLHFLPSSHVADCYQLRQIHGQLRGREPTSVQTTGIWVVDLKRKANICEAEVILLIKHVSGLNLLHCFQGENTNRFLQLSASLRSMRGFVAVPASVG